MRWAGLLLLCACDSRLTGKLALSWQFIDGRRCPDTGAASISVKVGSAPSRSFDCSDGVPPAAVLLEPISADGATIRVQALSTDSAPLYSGTLELDALPSEATVTLYADKMR